MPISKVVLLIYQPQTGWHLKAVFDKLAEGAEKERFQELHDMPFGTYGQFYDKYGVQWIFKGEKKA